MLFGSYPRRDANDPDTYVAAITLVLVSYEPDLIREVTDPNTGIQTTEKFQSYMPSSGELKRYCEARAAHRQRMKELAALPRPVPASRRLANPHIKVPGSLANIFVPEGHARYQRLAAWAPTADPRMFRFGLSSDRRPGIWVSLHVWENNIEAQPPVKHEQAAE